MPSAEQVLTWRPRVAGVREVLHATFVHHSYPPHTHEEWTLLLVDEGEVEYELDHRMRRAPAGSVTLLPPHVVHDGRSALSRGFRKRVLYLDPSWLPASLIGASVDRPMLPALAPALGAAHAALAEPGEELGAEVLLTGIRGAVLRRLRSTRMHRDAPSRGIAADTRDLLDSRIADGITLAECAERVGTDRTTLTRAFRRAFGISPHRYLTSRRVDLARHLLSEGLSPADAAARSGFYDQAHLTRHFSRTLGVTPAAYARGETRIRSAPSPGTPAGAGSPV